MPYVVTVLVLVFLGRKRLHAAPEGLRKVFEMAPTA